MITTARDEFSWSKGSRRTGSARPRWATMAIEVSHCGSGCTLGDLISEWVIYAFAFAVAGQVLFAEYIGDYVLAIALGIVFQYFAIAPMRGLSFAPSKISKRSVPLFTASRRLPLGNTST